MPQTAADKRTHVAQRRAALVASGILHSLCKGVRSSNEGTLYIGKNVSEDALSWIDSPDYQSYCADVLKVIRSMERPTIAEIKRGLGEKLNDARLMDSFGTLVAWKEIREATFVSPLRYEAVK